MAAAYRTSLRQALTLDAPEISICLLSGQFSAPSASVAYATVSVKFDAIM
jgi:hypothetical protein